MRIVLLDVCFEKKKREGKKGKSFLKKKKRQKKIPQEIEQCRP